MSDHDPASRLVYRRERDWSLNTTPETELVVVTWHKAKSSFAFMADATDFGAGEVADRGSTHPKQGT